MVHVEGVTKRFGKVLALRGIDLQLGQGRFLGIFGPNGAGKTTLLKILATLTPPSTGTVFIAGHDIVREAGTVRPLLGVLSHRTFLYGHLTALENLQFYGRMLGVKRLPERILEVLQTVGLETHARQLVRTYSRGMQQRLAIARAILHHPPLLLLDEPYTGLDQHAAAHLQELLRQLHAAERTVIMSTHDLQRGLELCDDIAIQHRGKIVYQGPALGGDVRAFEQLYTDYVR
jgi:heme ABC exporter ATP-binding subunit CcmA